MGSSNLQHELSRRRLLQVAGAAGLGLAVGGLDRAAQVAPAHAVPMTFGVAPFDRALSALGDNGYNLRSAGLAVNDQGSMLVDGTERTRRVLYQYADRVGPWVDNLGDLAHARALGRDPRYDGLLRVLRDLHVYTLPLPLARFYGLRRLFRVSERFGFCLLPNGDYDAGFGRPWPAPGDFWGLAYALDNQDTPFVWLIASTAAYRTISPFGASAAVRTEVVVQGNSDPQWLGYRPDESLLCCCLRQGSNDFFGFPSYL